MTDNEQCKLLEKFINDSSLATAIKVEVDINHKSFKPRLPGLTANYEECNMLANILSGAENFCYWLRRNNYKIEREKLYTISDKNKTLPKTFGKVKNTKKLKAFEKKLEKAKKYTQQNFN